MVDKDSINFDDIQLSDSLLRENEKSKNDWVMHILLIISVIALVGIIVYAVDQVRKKERKKEEEKKAEEEREKAILFIPEEKEGDGWEWAGMYHQRYRKNRPLSKHFTREDIYHAIDMLRQENNETV